MKKLLLLITILLSSLTLMNCSEDEDAVISIDSEVIGAWTAGEGNFATTLEFKSNGGYTEEGIFSGSGDFTVDAAVLEMTAKKMEGVDLPKEYQTTAKYTFEVKNDSLFLTATDDGLDRSFAKK